MTHNEKKLGKIVTFYSYKGGTGRTMSLANIGCILAQKGYNVLLIDWDLEAPGLPKYFKEQIIGTNGETKGVIEFFYLMNEMLPEIPYDDPETDEENFGEALTHFDAFLKNISIKSSKMDISLKMLVAGNEDDSYANRINDFDWQDFFNKRPAFFRAFVLFLQNQFDYVLIDSRTGHTDTGGICTMIMPERLVLVFTPNEQSFSGVKKLAIKAAKERRNSDDLRPLLIYPLPTRIEINEEKLRKEWKSRYRKSLKKLMSDIYGLQAEHLDFDRYTDLIQIRQASSYAYEEKIAVLEESPLDTVSIAMPYFRFAEYLETNRLPWTEVQQATEQEEEEQYRILVLNVIHELDHTWHIFGPHFDFFRSNDKITIFSESNVNSFIRDNPHPFGMLNKYNCFIIIASPNSIREIRKLEQLILKTNYSKIFYISLEPHFNPVFKSLSGLRFWKLPIRYSAISTAPDPHEAWSEVANFIAEKLQLN